MAARDAGDDAPTARLNPVGISTDLMTLRPIERRLWVAEQSDDDLVAIFAAFEAQFGSRLAMYQDDPVGFCEDVLGDFLWSRQRQIATSVRQNKRTVVPACVGPGKTFLAGRLVVWFIAVHAPGQALVATTAKRWRQVKNQLWPHIRNNARSLDLGRVLQTEWWMGDDQVAYGFAPNAYDESGTQGIHPPAPAGDLEGKLLLVVDEAGGIPPLMGNQLNGLLTGNARILAIGNPDTDEESSWFEGICESSVWKMIEISAFHTPNFTGEAVPERVAKQLIDQEYVTETAKQFGEDSAYYIAKVLAQFPKVFARKVIPVGWCEDAMENENPSDSKWQRIGLDVASDGGDEMVVAMADGWKVSIADVWAGADAADQTINAERVLEWIWKAEGRQKQLGYTDRKVRVKVDGIGIGSGTADILAMMGRDGKHGAHIEKVVVSEKAVDGAKFMNRRAEMWWTLRDVIRDGTIALDITAKEKAQLCGPVWKTETNGKIALEKKEKMKARGLSSPDRGDAIALAVYEPVPPGEAEDFAEQVASAQSFGRVRSRHE